MLTYGSVDCSTCRELLFSLARMIENVHMYYRSTFITFSH